MTNPTSHKRLTPEKLAEYRELLPLGRFAGVGGDALRVLLDEIEACWAERKPVKTADRRQQGIVAQSDEIERQLTGEKASFDNDAEDAAKWRALRNCARITAMGSAGLVKPQPHNYAHLTLNFWTVHDAPSEPYALEWLDKFVDIAIRAQSA